MFPLDPTNLKIVKYRRKSTEDEDRQVASLGDQAIALDEVIARFHVEQSQIVADFGESRSAKLSHGRPEFQKMVEMIERGQANAIVAWHPDRLSRNLGDVDTLVGLMEIRKLILIITPQYLFGNTPLEKYILISECTRAKLENDNKGVNVKRGLAGKVRKGWRPGIAKIGYLNNTSQQRGERDILPDPTRFPKVKRLLHMFLAGNCSVRQLRTIANDRLLLRTRQTKRQGGKPLSLSHVYSVLTDPFYCGKFWWKNQETGEKELQQGKHIPMITEEEYWRIQALLGKKGPLRSKTQLFAYTTLIRCGECGASVTAEEKWQIICAACKTKFASQNKDACPKCGTKIFKMERKTLLHYVYYHCTKKKGSCSQLGIRLEELESQIDQILMRFTLSQKYVDWALHTLKTQAANNSALRAQVDRDISREQTKLREELADSNRFIIKQESAGWTLMSKEEALAEKQRLLSQLKDLEKSKDGNHEASDGFNETKDALDYAANARCWLKTGTIDQKRQIFAVLGSNLTLKDKKMSIDLAYPLPKIERMVEIAPEIISGFEPRKLIGTTTHISSFREKIPALLRGLNDIRTYFMKGGNPLWKPQNSHFPSIRAHEPEDSGTKPHP